jgi:ATP-binding cassette subfamily C (CFTR/MRP) protein 10
MLSFSSVFFVVLMQASRNMFDFFLAHWTSSLQSIELYTRLRYLSYFAILNVIIAVIRSFLFAFAGLCAANVLHMRLVSSISNAGLRFFDSKSVGVIMNRVSSDVDAVDESLPFQLNILLAQAFLLLGCMSVICISCPALVVAVPLLGTAYFYLQVQYRHASRALKRLESAFRSPVYTLVSDVCDGAPIIRVMKAQNLFDVKFATSLQSYLCVVNSLQGGTQWFGLRLQLIGASVVLLICTFALIERLYPLQFLPLRSPAALAAFVGLSLSQAVPLSSYLNGFVMALAETEKQFVSVERILQMINDCLEDAECEHHACTSTFKVVSDSHSAIDVQNLSMLHRAEAIPSALVLRNVSFSLERGSYTAIVGRSGVGKSTLIHMIARFYLPTSGRVQLFGQDISSMPASVLRGDIVVVLVQEPFIFPASVRFNIDPFHRLSDNVCCLHGSDSSALWPGPGLGPQSPSSTPQLRTAAAHLRGPCNVCLFSNY